MRYGSEFVKQHPRIAFGPSMLRKMFCLYRQTDAMSKSVANVLRETLANDTTVEEKTWIKRIESLRKELNSSSEEITAVDYGARSPDSYLTRAQMNQGEIQTTTIGNLCLTCSSSYFWSFLLFKCIRKFRPSVCLELGTCLGISTSYLAAALKLNLAGRVVTLEGAETKARLAAQNFRELGLDNICTIVGRFQDTLDNVLENHGPIQFAFIDGHHEEKATLTYFERVFPFLSRRSLLIFDDVSWSLGMRRAWNSIEADERVKLSVDLSKIGICIIDDSNKEKIMC
jgi:hypothetical protein